MGHPIVIKWPYLKLPCIEPSYRCNEKIQVILSVKNRMFEIHGNSANKRKKASVAMQDKKLMYQVKVGYFQKAMGKFSKLSNRHS